MSKFNYKDDITWRDILIRSGIILATVALIIWFMPGDNRSSFSIEQGKPWKYNDFTAPFDFPVYKSEEALKHEQDSVMRTFEPYYIHDTNIGNAQKARLRTNHSDSIPGTHKTLMGFVADRLDSLYARGIVSMADYNELGKDSTRKVRIVSDKTAASVSIKQYLSTKEAYEQIFADKRIAPYRQQLQRCNLNDYITANVICDEAKNEQALNDLISSIPHATGVVQKGQKIIGRGDIVSEEAYRALESFKQENEKRGISDTQRGLNMAGEGLYILVLIACFTIYLTLFRKDYFEKPRSIAMLYALILALTLLTALMVRHNIGHVFMLPYAIVPIFVRVFMDSRTAFVTHVVMILSCASMLQYPFEFIAVETVAGMAAIYSLRELQYRSQLFKTAIIVMLVGMLMNFAIDLMSASSLTEIDSSNYNYLFANGVLLLFAYPLLYLMEKVFGFISDITLIELSNTNNELLRNLAELAPGTFQHSIQVGNLAAEIANKIGAKSQLVRTGALYHDIGKLQNPGYFTENQSGVNPHEHMSCIDSAQIIISHVTDGLKLADKHNLPTVIRDFISTHHGHGKAKFFAIKYKNEHPGEFVDDLLFIYPGPNPFTREQAILMMADAVEAASRSLPDYTEQSIRDLVNRIIDGIVADRFFHECPITFRDIAYAKTVLIEKLKTIYHARVSYPKG